MKRKSIEAAVLRLQPKQLNELAETMYEACIAMELGGDYSEIFRRAKNRKVGSLRRMYELAEDATPLQLMRMADRLVEG